MFSKKTFFKSLNILSSALGLPKFFLFGDTASFASKSIKGSGFTLALQDVKIGTFENEKAIQVFILLFVLISHFEININLLYGE